MILLPEILAPAGNMEALRAAVANGADAVYLGGKVFNARRQAANFTAQELAEAVVFAHLRGVKVYVTVNTLIAPEEFSQALQYLFELSTLGVDGVLVQDLGLARATRQVLPEVPLHASTQMAIHNIEGVRFLRRLGVRRVVLARELSVEDIRQIRAACPEVELEVFVHGALCFSYSGQCLLSSFVGARSGNRGRCAQPCRMRFRLQTRAGRTGDLVEGHLLSTRDLNLITVLPELVATGVAALKIEGRMKRPEYVATVTRIYRHALDRYACDPGAYRVEAEALRELAQIFNREFTTGYFSGPPGRNFMSYQRPNNRGIYLGRVVASGRGRAAVRLESPLSLGDGIEYWVSRGGHQGLTVRSIRQDGQELERAEKDATVWVEASPGVAVGDRVFKTYDRILVEKARSSYTGPRAGQTVPVDLRVSGRTGEPLRLAARDDLGHETLVTTEVECRPAEKHPLTPAALRSQLDRLGGTAFYLRELDCNLEGELMVPFSSLNDARRRLVMDMESVRLQDSRPYHPVAPEAFAARLRAAEPARIAQVRLPSKPKLTVAVSETATARAALAAGADRVYLTAEQWRDGPPTSQQDVAALIKEATAGGREIFPALPRLWHPTEAAELQAAMELLQALDPQGVLVGGPGGWEAVRGRFTGELVADYTFNVYNMTTAVFLKTSGFTGLTLSPELNRRQLSGLAPLAAVGGEIIVHGNFPLMVSAYCPLRADFCSGACRQKGHVLEDRLGFTFPVACDRRRRFYLFNSRDLCLLAELPGIIDLKPSGLRLELRWSEAEEVAAVVVTYRRYLDLCLAGPVSHELLAGAESGLMERYRRAFTRGHYYRGV